MEMLDSKKLGIDPITEKSASRLGDGWVFGTLVALALNQRVPKGMWTVSEAVQPDAFKLYDAASNRRLELPPNWHVQTQLYNDQENVADFCALWFSVPHGIEALWPKEGLPSDLLTLLLSDYLQLGESFTFPNYRKYVSGRGLKFLPFVVTPFQYRFFVYLPTASRVAQASAQFRKAIADLEGISSCLAAFLPDVYALIRLDEVKDQAPHEIGEALRVLQSRIFQAIGPYQRSLSYLYRDLPGPQTVRCFNFKMFSQ